MTNCVPSDTSLIPRNFIHVVL